MKQQLHIVKYLKISLVNCWGSLKQCIYISVQKDFGGSINVTAALSSKCSESPWFVCGKNRIHWAPWSVVTSYELLFSCWHFTSLPWLPFLWLSRWRQTFIFCWSCCNQRNGNKIKYGAVEDVVMGKETESMLRVMRMCMACLNGAVWYLSHCRNVRISTQ